MSINIRNFLKDLIWLYGAFLPVIGAFLPVIGAFLPVIIGSILDRNGKGFFIGGMITIFCLLFIIDKKLKLP